ncbi:MAG TPA: hypothetical protein VGM39_01335 [Kofleriaceae bacterium]
MKVEGQLKPPSMGIAVEPYPMSGRGALEVTKDALLIEGSKGYPIEVTLLGFLGFALACAASYVGYAYFDLRRALILFFIAGIGGGTALGYKLASRRERPRITTSFPSAQIVDALKDGDLVKITVKFRKHWQTRKQEVHFFPTDPSEGAALVKAVYDLRAGRTQMIAA